MCFPFKVWVIDDDINHLSILGQTLTSFGYQVTIWKSPADALFALPRKWHEIDIIVCGVPMAVMDSFLLVQSAEFNFNIPVIYLISDPSSDAACKGILSGAAQCVAKPIHDCRILRDIWQHVVHRRRGEFISKLCHLKHQALINSSLFKESAENRGIEDVVSRRGGPDCSNPKVPRMIEEDRDVSYHVQENPRKSRFNWTEELHQMFVDAIKYLNQSEKIIPTKILDYMRSRGVPNISRENVASHLQKYRLYLKKYSNNAVDQSSTVISLSTSPNVSEELGHVQTSPPNQTLQLQNISSNSPSTSHLPSENLMINEEQQKPPPPNQPNHEITPSIDQNNDINWDFFERIPIQKSSLNDMEWFKSSNWVIENYELESSLHVLEENDLSVLFNSHIINPIESSIAPPNQIFDHDLSYIAPNYPPNSFDQNPFDQDGCLSYQISTSPARKRSMINRNIMEDDDQGIQPKKNQKNW